MVFSYYGRLTPSQRRIYRRSDALRVVPLPGAEALSPLVADLRDALQRESRAMTEAAALRLVGRLHVRLGVPPVELSVLAARPSRSWGELHGLYATAEGRHPARITVWMRTAQQRRVVAFRTFLRTILHEVCHHLDYELLGLQDSFHTEGFFHRESSLMRALTEPAPGATPTPSRS